MPEAKTHALAVPFIEDTRTYKIAGTPIIKRRPENYHLRKTATAEGTETHLVIIYHSVAVYDLSGGERTREVADVRGVHTKLLVRQRTATLIATTSVECHARHIGLAVECHLNLREWKHQ